MVEDTRLLLVESDEPLGQFLDVSVEATLGPDDISVTEIDPNTIPVDISEVSD